MKQILSSELVEGLASHFPRTKSPDYAWGRAVSAHLLIPALHGFWPCSAHHDDHVNVNLDDIACNFGFVFNNNPTLQVWDGGLPPCIRFASASTQYLQNPDNGQWDILGTEPHTLAAQRGLALGLWIRFHNTTGAQGIFSKWTAAGNQRSYRIYKNAGNNIVFEVSNAGAAVDGTVTSSGTVAKDTWYRIFARFVPSTAMDIYLDSTRTTSVAAIPASINHSNAVLDIARSNATDYGNFYASLIWIAASRVWDNTAGTRDLLPFALYQHTRRLFGK